MHITNFIVISVFALAPIISAAAIPSKPDLAHEKGSKDMDAFMERLTKYIIEHPNHAKRDYYSDEHKEMNELEVKLTEWTTEHPDGKRYLSSGVPYMGTSGAGTSNIDKADKGIHQLERRESFKDWIECFFGIDCHQPATDGFGADCNGYNC